MAGIAAAIFVAGFSLGSVLQPASVLHAQMGKHVFELRTYTAPEGKLSELNARFRDHTNAHLQQAQHEERRLHDAAGRAGLAEHPDLRPRAHEPRGREEGLADFQADPEWQKYPPNRRSTAALSARWCRCSRIRPTTRR